MLRSLKSRLILASILWTCGLLAIMHMLSLFLMHAVPKIMGVDRFHTLVVGLALMGLGLLAGRFSLSPFAPLRDRLAAVRRGEAKRVEGEFPSEVQPLIDDLNALLAAREKAVERAQATAADLAHGLKTPLALLAREGGNVAQQVERMSRQIDYHLARARASAASTNTSCGVADCVEGLLRVFGKLQQTHTLVSRVPDDFSVKVQREDLDEILGNLLENACRFAKSRVEIGLDPGNAIVVDDDGPGLAPELREKVLQRGVRADESAPGSGIGLAIVRDLVELYGGSITLEASPLGGLRAVLRLPQA